ncbi:MAG: type I glutamate--ammonia ligase [Planctomycetaceae bacterium]
MTPREVLALCREREIRAVDLRFMDFPGTQKHFTIPVDALTEETFEDGFGINGSSLQGWQAINESDVLVVPQPETAFVDPFRDGTLAMTGNIQDPITREDYAKDPRNVARKAIHYMQSAGLADEARFGPRTEFFVFDRVRFDQNEHEAFYHVDSAEGQWNRGHEREAGGGNSIRHRQGYLAVPPTDTLQELRNEIMLAMIECGIGTIGHHHAVATSGQCQFDLAPGPLVTVADHLVRTRYLVKNAVAQRGQTATFMPKPLWNDNGSGLHLNLSLWKDNGPLFAGSGYGGLSQTAMHAMGGILKHAAALSAFCCPSTNSYKRLVAGFGAPVNLTYSYRNRSAAIRIPVHAVRPEDRRFEFRCPDASANAYLALAAVLMAALDGIQHQVDPGPPLDKDLYDLQPEELGEVPKMPGSLSEALGALRNDHEFLLRGDVFTEDVIDTWIWYKTEHEVSAIRERPHPFEFSMYYDV